MGKQVKAAVIVGPGNIEVREFEYPQADAGLVMKMEMSGICGTDKHSFRGEIKQHAGTPAEKDIPYPIIPGHENVGIIEEILGDHPDRLVDFDGQPLRVGDRITMSPDIVCGKCYWCRHNNGFPLCSGIRSLGTLVSCNEPPHLLGGWAEYMYLPPETCVFKVPEIEPRVAVLAELMAVAANLDKAREFSNTYSEGLLFGDTVAVVGIGPMGLLHIARARMMGAGTIIAIDKSPYRLELAGRFGADHLVNADETTRDERIAMVLELTDGVGPGIVVECAGVPEALLESLEIVRRGGMVLEPGNFVDAGTVEINPHKHICAKNVRLIGLTGHPVTAYKSSMEMMQRFQDVIPFHEAVTHQYSISQAQEAMKKAMSPDSMKVVLTP